MPQKILVYAFSSWGKNNQNLSEGVLQGLQLPVEKHVLQVRFEPQPFLDLLTQGATHIIGLGQYPTGRKIRIEQVAHNSYGTTKKGYQPITDGPEQLAVDLALQSTPESRLTYDAGRFVCNFSMYTILYHKQPQQKFAFLHIPISIDAAKATKAVESIIKQIV